MKLFRYLFTNKYFPYVALLISLAVSLYLWTYYSNISKRNNDAKFTTVTNEIDELISERFRIYENFLLSGGAFFNGSSDIKREEWKIFVTEQSLQVNYPGVQGFGFIKRVKYDELIDHETTIQNEGYNTYSVFPESLKEEYYPIIYIEPFENENLLVFGYDVSSEQRRREALEQSRDSGKPTITRRITLLQQTGAYKQAGLLMYYPIYERGKPHNTVQERRENLAGFVYMPFNVDDLMQGIIDNKNLLVDFEIYDATEHQEQNLLFDTDASIFTEDKYYNPKYSKEKNINIAGTRWDIIYTSRESFEKTIDRGTETGILMSGIIISMLLFYILTTLSASREQAIFLVNKMTASFRKSQESLYKAEEIGKTGGWTWVLSEPKPQWSNGTYLIFGLDPMSDVLDAQEYLNIIHPDDREKVKKNMDESRKIEGSFEIEYRIIVNDEIKWIRTRGVTQFKDGKPVQIDGINIDITNEKEIETAKSELISLASHQLLTPLGAIRWSTDMLNDKSVGALNQEQNKYYTQILNSVKKMIGLVNALLNVSRVDLGKYTINPVNTNLEKICLGVLKEFEPEIKSKNLNITNNFDNNLPVTFVDIDLMRIIFQNLISNSIKYTEADGSITINISTLENNFFVSIADTGCGIPTSANQYIFTKLYRADNVKVNNTDGNGLGLYLVKTILEEVGGKIWFESVENKGTIFYFTLPISGMKKKEGTRVLITEPISN